MSITTTTQMSGANSNFYDRNLLFVAYPLFVHNRWAQIRDLPANSETQTIKFRRYGKLAAATTELADGITPLATQLSKTDITAVIKHYGAYVVLTDEVLMTTMDPILSETSDLLGEQFADTIDQLCRDVMVAGSNALYGGSAVAPSGLAISDYITTTLLDKAIHTLDSGNTRYINKMVSPDNGYATTPIPAGYIAICSPEVKYTLEGFTSTGFIPVEKYANKAGVMEGEFGSYKNIRFIWTNNAYVNAGAGASSQDVHYTLVFGANAYGQSRISGHAVENIVTPLGAGEDPLKQRATSGWKATYVAKILNDDFITRICTSVAI